MFEARRTLVKSPPELWAEVSDPDSLARHLGAFGEIRITRLEPEATVAWEGDRARGTVELEASGWGTKVRLKAEAIEPALQQPLAAAEPEEEPVVEEAVEEEAVEEEPPPPAAVVEEEHPAAVEEEPAAAVEEEPSPARKGFFARWFRRRQHAEMVITVVDEVDPPPPEPEPEPEVVAEEKPVVEEPPAVEEPAAEGEITVSRLGDEEAAKVLDGMLDTLGAAHHRPFSRS